MSKAKRSHFSPGYGPRGRGSPRASWGGAFNEPQGFSGPLRRVQREGSGFVEAPAFLTHPASPSQGRAGLGGTVSRPSRPEGRDARHKQTEGDGRAVHPPVRWRDGEESACQQLPGNVPLLRPQQQQPPPLAPRLPPAHKEGWAAAATARA